MRFGINTFLWTINFGPDHFHVLPAVKQHGFDGVEVSLIEADAFQAGAIRRALEDLDLACTVCAVLPRHLSLISEEESVRAQTISHLSTAIKLTADAGARCIAGPVYAPVGYLPGRRRTDGEWQRMIDGCQQLGPVLDEAQVEFCIEPLNRFETFFLNTTADAVALCEAINHPRIGILWDTFHANIEEKNAGDSLRNAGKFLKHVHACENDRGIPGSGHVDWAGVFRALADVKYDSWLTIESFGFTSGAISAAAAIWRDLAPSPEEIAWQGIEFLQANYSQLSGKHARSAV